MIEQLRAETPAGRLGVSIS
jgi:hypothetical protein